MRVFLGKEIIKWNQNGQNAISSISFLDGELHVAKSILNFADSSKGNMKIYLLNLIIKHYKYIEEVALKKIPKIMVLLNEVPGTLKEKFYKNLNDLSSARKFLSFKSIRPHFEVTESLTNFTVYQEVKKEE